MNELSPSSKPPSGIKRFIILWMGLMMGCFVILSGALFIVNSTIHSMSLRAINDMNALKTAQKLERAILEEWREDMLWRTTGKAYFLQKKKNAMLVVENAFMELDNYNTSDEDDKLIEEIQKKYQDYYISAQSSPIQYLKMSRGSEAMIAAVERFRDRKEKTLESTVTSSRKLHLMLDQWTLSIIFFVSLIAAVGSYILIGRILKPTLSLIRTARSFGAGNLTARVPEGHADELGALCRTFNTMADDISDRDQAHRNFVASVVHDLNNPIMVIGASAARIKRKTAMPQELAPVLDRIIRQADRLEKMTHDLMIDIQIESGNLYLVKKELNLTVFLGETVSSQAEIAPEHDIQLSADEGLIVYADEKKLERVFSNLISNAAKYSPNGANIEVKATASKNFAVVEIRDHGEGMSREEIDSLFQPFGRLDRTKHLAAGAGLGLFSVKKIIEAHGGSISVRSEPGEGSAFIVSIPLFQ
ncbi:MAG TPA: HAMP domain-containing sensor histidine kinase [bacterium]|nr:HAMP domain-containing sensor histidine kinase [bacterium]